MTSVLESGVGLTIGPAENTNERRQREHKVTGYLCTGDGIHFISNEQDSGCGHYNQEASG